MREDGVETYSARNITDWREWLEVNHQIKKSLWLIIYKKSSSVPSITYHQAVDEALCFGWIDSKPNKRDSESYYQFFAKRNPKSNWSRVNKIRVEKLLKAGKMAPAGLRMIELAKKSGTWNALDAVEDLLIPEDLKHQFYNYPNSEQHFNNFPKSVKRGILEWIQSAKKSETRKKRVIETAQLAARNIRANQYRRPKNNSK